MYAGFFCDGSDKFLDGNPSDSPDVCAALLFRQNFWGNFGRVINMGRKKILGEDSEALSIRISKKQKESIESLVSQGKYKDLSEFVRKAIDDRLGLEWLR